MLEMFFINEKLDEDSVKNVESVEGPAVNIENGAFAWELNPEKPVVDELVLPLFYSRIFTCHYFSLFLKTMVVMLAMVMIAKANLNPEKPVVDELVLPLFYSRIFTCHYFSLFLKTMVVMLAMVMIAKANLMNILIVTK